MTTNSLAALPSLAAEYIRGHGWTQGTEEDSAGRVCLTGALRLCSPIPGDSYIAREVFRRRGRAERWNDANGRSTDEVIDYLATTTITDAELAEVFGPQEIISLVRAIAGATPQQIEDLAAARSAASRHALASTPASRAATRVASQAMLSGAGVDAAWATTPDIAWDARLSAWEAALALSTRDLIGTDVYMQQHYDLLTGPWRKVMGPLHVEDAQVQG